MAADLRELAIGAQQLVGAALWMRRGEADARNPRNCGDRLEKPREGLRVTAWARRIALVPRRVPLAIAQDALPQKAHFAHAMRGKRAHFSDDFPRRARILVASHVWNDAVAATVVAPDEHRDERLEAAIHMRGKRLGHHILAKFKPRETPVCDNLRNESDCARSNGEVKFRKFLEHIFAKALHCTAH